MAKVFVSYSRKDIEFAKRLTAELQKSDLDFWIDWEGIPPTVDWWREIEKGIEEADVFLFLISSDSSASKVCGKEIDCAVKNAKRVIPLVVRDIKGDEAPKQLSHLNWIFFREGDDFDAALKKLMTAIQTDYEWAATHRRLQIKALDWERNNKEGGFLLRGMDLLDAEQDLATNTSKDPHPTDLQREYVLASRKATDRQRRLLTSISIAGVIALAILAIFGFYQADKAIKQAQNSLARQLVAQAQSINIARNSKQNVAVLLSLQSLKLLTTIDAVNLLINNNFSVIPIRILKSDATVRSVAFSPDAKFVAGGGDCSETANTFGNCTSSIFVWDTSSGQNIAHLTHDGPVESIVFSSQGNYLFSSSSDRTARLWDIDSEKEIFRVSHDSSIQSIALSQDGKYTLSVDSNSSIRVWDIANKEEILHAILDGNSPSIDYAAFSPDSKKVAAGTCTESNTLGFCAKNLIHVWDLESGQPIANMTIEGGAFRVVFSPDGRYLLVGGDHADKTSLLLEITTQKEVARFSQNGIIWSAAFSPDGKYVLLGSAENTAQIWEISSGREVARMVHDGSVYSVAFSPDGKYAVSGSEDGTARVWDAMSGEEIARMTHEKGSIFSSVYSVAFSPDGKYVVSGGSDLTVRIWGTAGANRFVSMDHHQNGRALLLSSNGEFVFSDRDDNAYCVWNASSGKQVNCMKDYPGPFRSDGKYVAWAGSAGSAGLVGIWEAATGKKVLLKRQDYYPSSMAFSPDGKYILAESSYTDKGSCLWDATSGKKVTCMKHLLSMNSSGMVASVAFSPDGGHALSISEFDDTACVWELPSGKQVRCVTQDGDITSAALSPDGQYLITGGSVNTQVWEISSGNELFHTDQVSVNSVMFSPNGKYILTIGGNTICVWEVAIKKQVKCVSHDDQIGSAIFSTDSKYVVSASWDGTVRVWETASGQEVARKIHESRVTAAVFSLDGKYVISGSRDGNVRIWMWQLEDLIDDACSRLTRNLSRAEWEQYVSDAAPFPFNQKDAACPNLPIEPEVPKTQSATPTP